MKSIYLSQLIFLCNSAKDGIIEKSNTDIHYGKNKLGLKPGIAFQKNILLKIHYQKY
jgi:hypothetical protein